MRTVIILCLFISPAWADGPQAGATDALTIVEAPALVCRGTNIPNFNGTACVLKEPDDDRLTTSTPPPANPPQECDCECGPPIKPPFYF